MMEDINCIICNNRAKIALDNFKGYQEGEHFNIYYCESCDTSFVWPHVVDNKIYDYIYAQPGIVPGYNRYALYAAEITSQKNALDYLAGKEAMYFAIKEILAQHNDKTIKILEVGSGLGYLTYAISREGYDITGIDISLDAVQKATLQFGNHFICRDIYQYAIDNLKHFDIVLLTEVIEHLPDPNAFCDVLISLLKSGGKLIITTPNKSAYPPEEYWDTESPPVHLTWFSEDSFRVISKRKDLILSFFDFSQFNKKQLDITRFKFYNSFYKRKNRDYTLDREGKVITPAVLTADSVIGKFKAVLKKFIKPVYESVFIAFFTHNKNPDRNSILCVIFQKKA